MALTRRQKDVLDFLADFIEKNGYSPSYEEIAAGLFEKTKPGGVVIWVVGDRTVNGDETLSSFSHAFGAITLTSRPERWITSLSG